MGTLQRFSPRHQIQFCLHGIIFEKSEPFESISQLVSVQEAVYQEYIDGLTHILNDISSFQCKKNNVSDIHRAMHWYEYKYW